MLRKLGAFAILLASVISLSACVVAAPGPVVRRPGCAWVPGHYGPYGGWRPGHCA